MASFFFRERGRFALLSVITVLILSLGACDSGSGITMTYEVGDTGPSGGIVFYDNGSYTTDSLGNSWRYLECASADLDPGIPWGPNDTTTVTTSNSVGTGAANTSAIITAYGAATAANCAAKAWD